jgi:Skp family chaperone for outer membrane proteins
MRQFALILILLAVSAGSVFAGRSMAEPKEAVRYVDVQRCLLEWDALQARSTAVQQSFQGLSAQFNQAYQDLQAQKDDASMQEGEARLDLEFQIRIQEETLKAQIEFATNKFNDQQTQLLEEGVRRIHALVAEVGEREGYSAILMHPNPVQPVGEQFSTRDAISEMNNRWVLWNNANYDLTDEVLQLLNQQQ